MAEPGSAATPFPAEALEQSWGHRFRTIAKLYPHRIALANRTRSFTYAELESASNNIANAIRQIAKQPHRTVAVALPDPLDAVTAMLGVIASGHVFLPVDPAWPDHHLQAVLTRMHADLLIVPGKQPPPGAAVPCIGFEEAIATPDDGVLTSPAPGDPACLYATSGSTGEARGIVLPHRCLMNAARNYIDRMEVTPDDRIAWTNPITAGAALLPIMSALLSGASLHRFDLRAEGFTRFKTWMEHERITIWSAVPSLFRSFADHLPPGPNLPALRLIKLGGEPVYATDVALFEQRSALSCRLMNGLGITECGGNVCWHNHARGENVTTPTLPVGRALPGMKLSIRHDDAPDASPGELVVHSAYLALGYWNSATGAIDPFPIDPDTQLAEFRTGDLVMQDPHGALIHLGRNDGMLKVRGHRIERTRIEAALLALPWIREASVSVQSATSVDQLVAHVVWRDHSTPEFEDMRKALLRSLPVHEIPSRFIPVAALPRLSGGKIDRVALRNMMDEEPSAVDGPAPDLLERQLLVVWEKALGRKPRSVEEDFFAAGGDSLAAVRLFAQLDQRLGINLPIATLSHHRTVRALAAHVNALGKAAARSCAHLLQAGDHRTPLFTIPGAGSDSLALLELAQSLDPRQTVYAMQYAGLAEGEAFQNRIPEIAERFLREVRRIQPSGPYALAGTSFGGWVAFEMAQQLLAAGERVATLALLDTFGPGYLDPLPDPTLRRRALHALRWWFPLGNKEELSFSNLRAGIREKMERLAARGLRLVQPDRVLPRKLRYLHLQEQCFAAGKAYRPTPYHGGIIHLFRAEKQPPASLFRITPDMGWTPLAAAGLRIHDVPGHHGAHIRSPHVQELARQLQACLPGLTTTEPGRFSELADQSRARWDELAAWWDAQSADEGHADTRNVLLPLCLHLLQPKKDEHVIDAACGNGWIARRLARLGARVTAFDYSAALLERARQRDHDDRIEYLHLDATRADELARLGRRTADSALCYMALMDIADLVPLLTALSRAVRPGGRFVFTMIHPDSAALARVNEAQVLTSMGKNDQPVEHYYFHRPMSLLLDTFEQCGWEIDQLSSPGTPDGARFLVGRLINTGA